MKLVRYGPAGEERPGLIDVEGHVRDLSAQIPDVTAAALTPDRLARLAKVAPSSLPRVEGRPRLGPPIAFTPKFIAIGLNYVAHAEESRMETPAEPVVFQKAVSCIGGAYDPIVLPPGSTATDWEAELGVVIGTLARRVSADTALDHVLGYVVVNDVSERDWQLRRGGTWDKGKGFDTFGPIGPWLVTPDEVPDPQALDLWLDVNGVRKQAASTREMIFGVAELVAYVSQFMTLQPGDVIATGTPAGVGMGREPPEALKPGDVVTLGITGLGEQRQRVVAAEEELVPA